MGQQPSFPSEPKSSILEQTIDTEIDFNTDSQPKSKINTTLDYTGPFFSSIFTQNSNSIVIGGLDGSLFHVSDNTKICVLNGHTSDITCLAFDPTINLIASGSRDEYICLWDKTQISDNTKPRGYPINNLHGHELTVTALAIKNGELFSGSRDNTVCLWDIKTGICIKRCSIPRNLVTGVKFVPDGNCILQSSEDKHLRVWDTRTMDIVQNMLHPQCLLTSCEVSENGNYFYTSSRGPVENTATATQWDRRVGSILREYPHLSDNLHTCLLSHEMNILMTASNGGSLYLWDVNSGLLLFEKKLYSGPIYSLDQICENSDILCSTHRKGVQIVRINSFISGQKYDVSVKTIIQ